MLSAACWMLELMSIAKTKRAEQVKYYYPHFCAYFYRNPSDSKMIVDTAVTGFG
jgi:hypothetical protein